MNHMILANGEYAQGFFVPEGAELIDSGKPSTAHKWIDNKWVFQGFSEEEAMIECRDQRNRLLFQTDWWASSDLTMTQEQKDYRKALRDLPSTASPELDEDGQLTGVDWPENPKEAV